jgi:K+-H+ exchange-related protein
LTVFLLPIGRSRFELYSEVGEDLPAPPAPQSGRLRRSVHAANVQWHQLVERARRGKPQSTLARWRDTIVCRLAEAIAEQRTLWALRSRTAATLRHPADVAEAAARAVLLSSLGRARVHHLRWFIFDALLFVGSGVFFFIPGPNLVAYYFTFRFVGHLQSWRGARQGLERIEWTFEPDGELAALGSLVDLPREARAPLVAEIAAKLNLPRLSAFFDRVAVPST